MLEKYGDYLTTEEVREILKIGKNFCYELIHSGQIASAKVGKSYRVSKKSVRAYLVKNKFGRNGNG